MPGVFAIASLDLLDEAPACPGEEFLREELWIEIQESIHAGGHVFLGRASNGILNSRQPARLSATSGEYVSFIDGEIYNRDELWRSLGDDRLSESNDADLLVHLTRNASPRDWIGRCRGSFLFTIWDSTRKHLFIGNDRFGLRPHYSQWDGRRLVLGPRVRMVMACSHSSPELDFKSVTEYFNFQCIFEDRTFFKDVSTFPYASLLSLDLTSMNLSLHRYWDFDRIERRPTVSFHEAADELAQRFVRAVREQCDSKHRFGVMLSGGLDSRMILGAASGCSQLTTFTYGLPHSLDLLYAKRLARLANANHYADAASSGRWVRDNSAKHLELTEGFHCLFHMHGFQLRHLIRDHCDINLSGFAGDLIVGGSKIQRCSLGSSADWMALVRSIYNFNVSSHGLALRNELEFRQMFTDDAWDRLRNETPAQCMHDALEPLRHYSRELVSDCFHFVNRLRKQISYFLVFMRPYFEDREPYCDYAFVEEVLAVPARYRLGRRLHIAVLERVAPELTTVPVTDTDKPPSLKRRIQWMSRLRQESNRLGNRLTCGRFFRPRSAAYQDYSGWLRGDLGDWAKDILMDDRTSSRGIFSPAFVESALRQHGLGDEDCTWTIGTMLSFELMLRELVDRR